MIGEREGRMVLGAIRWGRGGGGKGGRVIGGARGGVLRCVSYGVCEGGGVM